MSFVWKVAVGLAVVLMLPVAAYAAGSLTAPSDAPAPRRDIVIDAPSPTKASHDPDGSTKAEREARDRRRDRRDEKRDARDDRDDRDDVKVVTPQPTPVNGTDDDGDDGDDDDDEWED